MDRNTSFWRPLALVLLGLLGLGLVAWFVLTDRGYEFRVQDARGVAGTSLLQVGATSAGPFEPLEQPPSATPPRNLIVLYADGMGFPHLLAARAATVGLEGRLTLERLPVAGWHTTYSPGRIYTDSAAGATALTTGVKTVPGHLAMDPAGAPIPTLMERALSAGKLGGLVTDSYAWDASTSAWVAHQTDRHDRQGVADDLAASGVSLLLGEAHPGHDEARNAELLAPFEAAGWRIARTPNELDASDDARVIGLFAPGSIADGAAAPDLPELTRYALSRLARGPEGFILFVETEEVDSGAHNEDLDRVIRGLAALDRAARQVVDFARDSDDTLVLFTSDHETSGLALADARDGEPLRAFWPDTNHTGAPVPLLAWGPGAERFAGVHDNAEVGRILAEVMGLDARGASSDVGEPGGAPQQDDPQHDPGERQSLGGTSGESDDDAAADPAADR